jgi:hypothetical protein
MKTSKKLLGDRLFKLLMKSTFYGHFVAGEYQFLIRPTLERLRSFGVKPILDYSVEEEISQEETERREVQQVYQRQEMRSLKALFHSITWTSSLLIVCTKCRVHVLTSTWMRHSVNATLRSSISVWKLYQVPLLEQVYVASS